MTTERWDDAKLDKFAAAVEQAIVKSDERLTRIEQVVESNNRFLESFSQDLKQYTDSMNSFATRIDGVIATNNQDRQETNSRLAIIQRQVSAIAKHLEIEGRNQ